MMDGTRSEIYFRKMHGLGNDFVVLDMRDAKRELSSRLITVFADRHRGVGFDQLVLIHQSDCAAAKLIFYNADGSVSGTCGNASRCVAWLLMQETGLDALSLETEGGLLAARAGADGQISVNMGPPRVQWDEIPLATAVDSLHLPIEGDPVATSMGNPHCTFFVDDLVSVDLATRGAAIEHHPLFPQRTNVQFVQKIAENHLRMRVWERGVGVTLASGSSSCAVAVAAIRRKILAGPNVQVDLDGGRLWIKWDKQGVWMTGQVALVFDGWLSQSFVKEHA